MESGIETWLQEGFFRHQQGDVAGAMELYHRILAADPQQADALHLSGVAFLQQGQLQQAVTLLRQAVARQPNNVSFLNNCSLALQQVGQLPEAISCLERLLVLQPDFAEGWFSKANLHAALRQVQQAVVAFQNALRLRPDHVEGWNNLGLVWQELAQWQEARACFEKAVALEPQKPELWYNFGNIHLTLEQLPQAEHCFRQALARGMVKAAVVSNLGVVLRRLGRWQEAESQCRRAVELDPSHGRSHLQLGHLLQQTGRLEEADACYIRARQLDPRQGAAWENLGNLYFDQKRLEEALDCFNQAVERSPEDAALLAKRLHVAMHLCEWSDYEGRWQSFLTAWQKRPQTPVDPFILVALPATPGEQRMAACHHAQSQGIKPLARLERVTSVSTVREEKLRIGYLSGDFRDHPTSFLIMEVLEQQDRERFDIIGYDYGKPASGATRERLERCFAPMVNIAHLSMEEAAGRIRQDGIHILVDLMGFIKGARLGILAQRPAPVSVHWLAYPGTMGGAAVDYLIADRRVIPPGWEDSYGEALVFMPDSYQSNDRQRIIGPTPTRSQCGLPEEGLVYCSFNQTYKILPEWFALWMGALRETPGSVLWQLDGGTLASHNLRQAALRHGVDPQRIIFAPRLSLSDHLGRLALADLMLDTFPCNGHTTVSDALWAGVPTVTLAGETFPARVAASLLHAAGVPHLMTHSRQEYVQKIRQLTQQPELLRAIRHQLQQTRLTCPLFDSQRYTRHLEQAFQTMWQNHQAGWGPVSFEVTLQADRML
ncbi:MAG: tetratricopeptide repeat protein [Magnetococcales bacterium]|nr:tetratricopeptide repeat protein [Magnetococcales bacterium]NGZ25531.1 tetratricopeptide repeat protein [Magnetococcales bacterium]